MQVINATTPTEAHLKGRIQQLGQQLSDVDRELKVVGDRFLKQSKDLDHEISRNHWRMQNYPKIKKSLPLVAFASLGIGMAALGATPGLYQFAGVTGMAIGLTVGGVALATTAGTVVANERLKSELQLVPSTFAGVPYMAPKVERDYYQSLAKKDTISQTSGFEGVYQKRAAVGEELKLANEQLQRLENVSEEVLQMARKTTDHYQNQIQDFGEFINVGDFELERKD